MSSVTEQTAARDLLAVIFRDGGHYREEHGIQSYADAKDIVLKLREEDVPSADDLLYVLELVQDYCKDVRSGSYRVETGEIPLRKIGDIINIGKTGSLKRPLQSQTQVKYE